MKLDELILRQGEVLNYTIQKSHLDTVYQLLISQIQKDIDLTGLNYHLTASSPTELPQALNRIIIQVIEKEDIRNLLYRIDVSEKRIRQINNLSPEDITKLVLEREVTKVLIRLQYS